MGKTFSLILVLTPLLVFSLALRAASAKDCLTSAVIFFDKGQYKKALELIAHLDIRSDFDNSDDMKLAFKIRAVAYEQTGKLDRARETIRDLFFLDPTYRFNLFDTPKTVVDLAEKEKELFDAKNAQIASIKNETKQTPEENSIASPEAPIVSPDLERPHWGKTLFPLGINHFYLGSPLKGGIYFSVQALGLIGNITAFWWKQAYLQSYGSSLLINQRYQKSFETAQMIQYIGLSVAVLGFCISVIDGLIKLKTSSL